MAEVQRDQSLYSSLNKSSITLEQPDQTSIERDISELDPQEEKVRLREQKLMEILKQCEIPK